VTTEPNHTSRRIYCAQCKKPKPRVSPPKTEFPNHTHHLLLDPFCSRTCCEGFYGIELRPTSGLELAA
jgi:hypothetical protein